jgi:hypothetical protein
MLPRLWVPLTLVVGAERNSHSGAALTASRVAKSVAVSTPLHIGWLTVAVIVVSIFDLGGQFLAVAPVDICASCVLVVADRTGVVVPLDRLLGLWRVDACAAAGIASRGTAGSTGRGCNNSIRGSVLKGVALVRITREAEVSPTDRAEEFRVLARDQLCRLYSIARRLVGVEVDVDEVERFSLYRTIAYETLSLLRLAAPGLLAGFSRDDVRAVLMALPELYRLPLALVYMDGYLAREVADMLQAPLGTVLARLHRGRKQFEGEMWDYAQTNGLLREDRRDWLR